MIFNLEQLFNDFLIMPQLAIERNDGDQISSIKATYTSHKIKDLELKCRSVLVQNSEFFRKLRMRQASVRSLKPNQE